MRSYWHVIFGLIATSFASNPIVLPICCGYDAPDSNFTVHYNECNEIIEEPDNVFKREWKGRNISWIYSPSPILCLTHYPVNENDFEIQENGSLAIPGCNGGPCCHDKPSIYTVVNWTDNMAFCMDYLDKKIVAWICQDPASTKKKETLPSRGQNICLVVSAVLLLVTCAVLLTEKPDKMDNYVPYLVSHSFSLAAAFACLARIRIFPKILNCWECLIAGYLSQFFFLAAFFWMNAMCINKYVDLSGLRQYKCPGKMLQKLRWRKFKRFSMYAWGAPLLITVTTFLLQIFDVIENPLMKPDIGTNACFFERATVKWIYFYGIMAIIIVMNIILFALIAAILIKNRVDISKAVKGCKKNKSTLQQEIWFFNQYFKLFIITGLSWLGEVVEAAFMDDGTDSDLQILWKVTDIFNCLQGVFIFYFFVCQKEVLIKKVLCIPKNFKWKILLPSERILCCCSAENRILDTTHHSERGTPSAESAGQHADIQSEIPKHNITEILSSSVESVEYESVQLND